MTRNTDRTIDSVRHSKAQRRMLKEIADGKIERIASPNGWVFRRGGTTMDRTGRSVVERILEVHPKLVETPAPTLRGPTSGRLWLTEAGQQLHRQLYGCES